MNVIHQGNLFSVSSSTTFFASFFVVESANMYLSLSLTQKLHTVDQRFLSFSQNILFSFFDEVSSDSILKVIYPKNYNKNNEYMYVL